MSEPHPHPSDPGHPSRSGHTSAYPTMPPPAGPPPAGPPSGPPASSARPRRSRLVPGVLAASLLVGGAAGFGGAAVWDAFDEDPAPASSRTEPTAQVSDSRDTPADPGSVQAVADTVLPSVVKIDVTGAQGAGSGSGIVLSSDGRILTNDHVVSLAERGGEISVSFADGSRAAAEVLGTDPLTDIAVIQAQDVEGLTAATIGRSSELDVGEAVVAVGSPYGLDATVTSGIVSALNRPVEVGEDPSGSTTAYPAIQTDAAINPGNSGGPLVDMNGHVVGINSSIRTTGSSSPFGQSGPGGSIGLGFAIPIDAAMPIVEQIAAGEEPTHARLGITVSAVSAEGGAAAAEGAQVREVGEDSAAAEAGLEPGDVITRVDDHAVTGPDSLIAMIRAYRPGETVTVTYQRDGEEQTTELELDSDATES